jgi:DNA helicase-2/ATP-dependent DNA helicase PcrA
MKPVRRRGKRVVALTSSDEQEEAGLVVSWIGRMVRRGEVRLGRTAILVRQPVLLRAFEEALVKEGVTYRVSGSPRFYERREIKDTLAYLHLCLPPGLPEALARIANAPRRGIGPASVRTLARIQQQHGVGLAEAAMRAASLPRVTAARAGALADLGRLLTDLEEGARRLAAADLIDYVVERSGYGVLLGELSSASNAETRREGIDELRGIARGFPGVAAESLSALFARVALVGSAPGSPTSDARGPEDGVRLMTLAGSRGSEVDVVFLSGLEEEVIPSRRALAAGDAAIQAERRLVYLGMTRARNRLILLSTLARTMQGEVRTGAPSRFLVEAGRRVRRFRVGTARATARAETQPGQAAEPLLQVREGQRVSHTSWGTGVVVACDGKFVTVRFDEAGEKRLALSLARLRPA